jgi:hypothetical protein
MREWLTNRPNENLKGTVLDVRSASKVDQFDLALAVENNILVLDVSVHNEGFGMEVVDGVDNLSEDVFAFGLVHIRSQLNVVEQIHARYAMRNHLNVIVALVLEKIDHLHNVRMAHPVSPEIIHDMDLQGNSAQAAIPCPGVNENACLRDIFQNHLS